MTRTNHITCFNRCLSGGHGGVVASGVAWPLRTVLYRSQRNVRVLMEEVIAIDCAGRSVRLRESPPMSFDVLIIAPGSRHAYFGHDEWEPLAPRGTDADGCRSDAREDAAAFEEADRRRAAAGRGVVFVIVGGGPTGVELAGALQEIGRKSMGPDFPTLRLEDVHSAR